MVSLTGEKEEEKDEHERVSKVQESGDPALDVQLGEEVVDTVDEEVQCSTPTCQETSPPPVVILLYYKQEIK